MNVERTKKITKFAVTSAMVVNALAAPVAVFAAEETIAPDAVQAAIKELMEKSIMVGGPNGELNLEGKLTRVQVAAIIARSLNLETPEIPTSKFSDVSSDNWGLKYIYALEKVGIMIGSNGAFRPNAILKKEELAAILVRITQTNITGKGTDLPISDSNEISDWAKAYVHAAIDAKLLTVTDGKFAPQNQVERKDVAVLTAGFIKEEKFEQYKESINTLLEEGKKISNSDPTV
ncbi:S-layer homology domain-containing protein [Paenibacillus sinopodophylli]|uniref:S-layer homology domain-containing protein n=1 Tax=Paenibacillus sinopodophylli TaxID=1837342 RepID=UPI001FED168D|nr:S-layer homology domain-containing protein [Paenibacillus sinopodophylli]